MNDLEQLISLYEKAKNLETLKPGYGYDEIGYAFCDFIARPRTLSDTRSILDNAKEIHPNIIKDFQKISFESEFLHEEYHAKLFLEGYYKSVQDLMNGYGYDWPMGKARAELSFIPPNKKANVLYFCGGMVPFAVIALKKLAPDLNITWIDDDQERLRSIDHVIERSKEFSDIQTAFFDNAKIKSLFQGLDDDSVSIAFLVGTRFQSKKIIDSLWAQGCDFICINGTEGMAELMYPAFSPFEDIQNYTFLHGLTPNHIIDKPRDKFDKSSDLSFLSLALLERSK